MRYLLDQRKPSIAMATVCFERIGLSRARSAAFGGRRPLTKQSFRNFLLPLRSTAQCDEARLLQREPHHSALMCADEITVAHLRVSSAVNFSSAAGLIGDGWTPNAARRALLLGSLRLALISAFSFSTIAAGVPFGAPMPSQALAS